MRRLTSGAWLCLLAASCLAACSGQLRSAGGPEAESSAVAWAHIPAGSFEMGCSEGDDDCMPDERPRRHVDVAAFDLATTETTQAEYAAVTGERPSTFAGCDACPVESITWNEAIAFCNAIGGRLPTEAEWEYAARAGRPGSICGTNDPKCLGTFAWYEGSAQGKTHPVPKSITSSSVPASMTPPWASTPTSPSNAIEAPGLPKCRAYKSAPLGSSFATTKSKRLLSAL